MYAVTDGGCRGTRGSRGKPHSLWRDAKFAPTRLRLRDVIIIYYNKPRFDIPRASRSPAWSWNSENLRRSRATSNDDRRYSGNAQLIMNLSDESRATRVASSSSSATFRRLTVRVIYVFQKFKNQVCLGNWSSRRGYVYRAKILNLR